MSGAVRRWLFADQLLQVSDWRYSLMNWVTTRPK
jgi:hypothetical protein